MVQQSKLKEVEKLQKRIEEAQVVGVLDMFKLPSKQYQEIQKQLRDDVDFVSIKKSILLHALEKVGRENIKDIVKEMPVQPMLVFTKTDPFKFYMKASKLKSPNYAKGGDKAEEEIEVTAGPTDLMPGPAIAEFSKVGIPAGVEGGKIAVKKDKVVAKAGDEISTDLANILRKLKIQPMNVGLNIVSVYDKGTIYNNDVLSMAGQGYINQTISAHQHAINLTVFVSYPTKDNIGMLLAKAEREAQALQSKLPEEKSEAPAESEAPKEEAKPEAAEEKTEEVKAEEKSDEKTEEKSETAEEPKGGN